MNSHKLVMEVIQFMNRMCVCCNVGVSCLCLVNSHVAVLCGSFLLLWLSLNCDTLFSLVVSLWFLIYSVLLLFYSCLRLSLNTAYV